MVEVEWCRQDDLVTHVGDGENGVDEGHVGSGGDEDSVLWIDMDPVFVFQLFPDQFEQGRNALSELVLVVFDVFAKSIDSLIGVFRWSPTHYALPHRNGSRIVSRPFGYDRDDGRLHGRCSRCFWKSNFPKVVHLRMYVMISRLSEGLSRNTFSVSVTLLLFRLNFYPQIKKRDSQEKSPALK